jgi:hypothetical protein
MGLDEEEAPLLDQKGRFKCQPDGFSTGVPSGWVPWSGSTVSGFAGVAGGFVSLMSAPLAWSCHEAGAVAFPVSAHTPPPLTADETQGPPVGDARGVPLGPATALARLWS